MMLIHGLLNKGKLELMVDEFVQVHQTIIMQNSRFFFFSKSVKNSVKRGVRVLSARNAQASHARRVTCPVTCEAGEKNIFLASRPSLALCFQPRSRPFV